VNDGLVRRRPAVCQLVLVLLMRQVVMMMMLVMVLVGTRFHRRRRRLHLETKQILSVTHSLEA